MAKQLKPGDGAGVGHNSAARKDQIILVIAELVGLEARRKTLGAEIRELKQTKIKGELGMKIVDFNAAYRLYQLEDDDRRAYLETLQETFQALGIGEQLDWVNSQAAVAEGAPA